MTLLRNLLGTTPVSGDTQNVADVFSTYLFDGTGTTHNIVNGIDLEGKGGMIWFKSRNAGGNMYIFDSSSDFGESIYPDGTSPADIRPDISSVNADGFTLVGNNVNYTEYNQCSWTFRKRKRFFDVVTWTGNSTVRTITHSLGITPGMIVIKKTTNGGSWSVQHRSLNTTSSQFIHLDQNNDARTNSGLFNNTEATATHFTVGTDWDVNGQGERYVAYIFAHDPNGEDNDGMIACGSYTASSGVDAVINLGWEAQYVMIKQSSLGTANREWYITDSMRGLNHSGEGVWFNIDGGLEGSSSAYEVLPDPNGFIVPSTEHDSLHEHGMTYIYMAIRAPMMKEPEAGTEVFEASYGLDASANNGKVWEAGFPVDMYFRTDRTGGSNYLSDRIRGSINYLVPHGTQAESSVPYSDRLDNQTGVYSTNPFNYSSGPTWAGWMFKRAKGFFDIAAYTGNYSANPQMPHSLGVAPEMIIAKSRDSVGQWYIKHTGMDNNKDIYFNANAASPAAGWSATATHWQMQAAQYPYDPHIAYLFASLDGVSKVGSYTGTGHGDGEPLYGNIDCGFSNGARFVMIKRIDSTGDWFFWDTNRGINTGNDPHLSMNLQAGEVTSDDSIDPYPAGFSVNQNTTTHINVYQATYIFLAIA